MNEPGHRLPAMPPTQLSVLYADVSGSTRLYEEHGDEAARSAMGECIAVMVGVIERFSGRLVKTIGDEILCVFENPSRAIMAANEVQLAVRSAGEAGRFATGALSIKIGIHYGPGVEREDDVFGEASIIAQQVIKQAKAGQILASAETVEALPPELRYGTRPFDRIDADGRDGMLEILEIIWEVEDLTRMVDTRAVKREPGHTRCRIRYQGATIELSQARPSMTIGRTEQNDLVVPVQLASRTHAEIELRRGKFYLRDMSSNGTVIITEEGESNVLRGESVVLEGRGNFCLGSAPAQNPEGVVEYECE